MPKYKVVKCRIGTLERVKEAIIEAESVEKAKKTGEERYSEPGFFIGAESISDNK